MEEEASTGKSRVAQLDTNIKTLSDEIMKANEIIRKLQHDNKNIHAKVSRCKYCLRIFATGIGIMDLSFFHSIFCKTLTQS